RRCRRQGAGSGDGAAIAEAGPAAAPGRRCGCRGPGAVPPGTRSGAGSTGRCSAECPVIGSLRGTLLDRSSAGEVLIEVGGVGHRVQAGPATAARLGDVGAEAFAWIHHHVREDADTLYGFAD